MADNLEPPRGRYIDRPRPGQGHGKFFFIGSENSWNGICDFFSDRLTAGGAGYLGDPRDNDSLGEDSDNWAGTSTDNNWTDYDQDIYMHRNPTHKFGTRPGFGRDDVNLWID